MSDDVKTEATTTANVEPTPRNHGVFRRVFPGKVRNFVDRYGSDDEDDEKKDLNMQPFWMISQMDRELDS